MESQNQGPLKGVRLTEFTSAWAGPYAACLLGFLGAEVIKVESRRRLDHSRVLSFSTGRKFENPDQSPVFNNLNLNKKSVNLNLTQPRAIELARKLAMVSDVVMENMRPGVMERLGLGYEVLRQEKPDIIYLSSSACGQVGPHRQYVGYAPTFAALGGLSHITGYEDWPPSNFMGAIDLRSATTSALAMVSALIQHQRTGRGQYIDMASQESIAVMNGEALMDYILNGRVRGRRGNREDGMAPHNCYCCAGEDQWVSIAVCTDEEWQALCRAMGQPELAQDPRFSDRETRWRNQEELDGIITVWTRDRDAYRVTEILQQAGVAAAPSLSAEGLFNDPHLKEREVLRQVDHPEVGRDWVVAPPWRLSATPAGIRRHAPLLGEDNDYVFQTLLGMDPEEIESLKAEQVIY
ncbi:MAG: CoA transferase [Proteobacteria bacterium]|nr:CoA transferase [Pseudomonadota bacterium]